MEARGGIIVESDSKLCVDAIGLDKADCDRNISTLCNDAIGLAAEFNFCKFCWIKREANMAMHTLTKLCTPQELPVPSCALRKNSLLFIFLKISQPL